MRTRLLNGYVISVLSSPAVDNDGFRYTDWSYQVSAPDGTIVATVDGLTSRESAERRATDDALKAARTARTTGIADFYPEPRESR